MIEIISSWAKSLGVTIVLVSILEMILPNNKTKKYIRIVLGVFIIFNIIAPFIQNKENLSLASIDIEDYYREGNNDITNSRSNGDLDKSNSENLNQTSMDARIKQLYEDELEKDITKKVEEQGYIVSKCTVEANVPTEESTGTSDNENETGIIKIELKIGGKEEVSEENKNENSEEQEKSLENKIVTGVQRIKEIDVSGDGVKKQQSENEEINTKVTRSDIQNIKKFLIEEYGVSEKCLAIS